MNEPEPSLAVRVTYGFYKSVLSPILHAFSPTQCLYLPTCSEYAYVALVRFGVWKGSWLALRRLARCHPFAKGGVDPVPLRNSGAIQPSACPQTIYHRASVCESSTNSLRR
ncbi:membrane protein insertion efficiency factor YidD [Tunturiibacter lichenicola]|uniref:membrane protein insertion efficiency factor YidD n=1 Tax=Tunturiibacter lichenicola TaxID=2051959 RepID=UPI0021B1C102|nr:membrane protein insertion efficiency factor YidD [Edaphobacter lichenicola]